MQKEQGNVYQRSAAAVSYAEFARYDTKLFRQIVQKLNKIGLDSTQKYSILDIGVGACDFAIPLVQELIKEGVDVVLYGFDISKAMIDQGLNKLQDTDMAGRIWLSLHDMRDDLKNFPVNNWNIICSIFSLHYTPNWRSLINKIYQVLPTGGLWIVTEASGDIPLLEAEFDAVKNPDLMIYEFWKYYHEKRQAISSWHPELKTSKMGPVLSEGRSLFDNLSTVEVLWWRHLCVNDFISWISSGVIGAFGAGINEAERKHLALEMEKWYAGNRNKISKTLVFRFCVKTHFFQKL